MLLILGLLATAIPLNAAALSNAAYQVASTPQGFSLQAREAGDWSFSTEFIVLFTAKDPKPQNRPAGIANVSYNVITWQAADVAATGLKAVGRAQDQVGDGFDERILKGDTAGRTADLFQAARSARVRAASVQQTGDVLRWVFPDHASFALRAELTLPPGAGEPVLRFTLTARRDGFYSAGYTGAPEFALEDVAEIWQPLIWQEKRFPEQSFLTPAYHCPVPSALVSRDGVTLGVVADPTEFPFDPLPTADNNRFGIAVRNATGKAQPMLFAPVLGGLGSQLRAGENFSFTMRLFASQGGCTTAFERIAREIYGFRDYRRNTLCSLNTTLENIVDYGMSHYSWFEGGLKGCAYSTDVPGAVKNVSSLNPLQFALVTDDAGIWTERAYPILEYMLSREKFLFSLDPKQKIQSPSRAMTGPCAPLSELTSLFGISHQSSPVLLELARREFGRKRVLNLDDEERGDSWKNALALYHVTGERDYLERAKRGADEYLRRRVRTPQTDFRDPDVGRPFFWTSFAPKWADLTELYEATGEQRYLEAAVTSARRFAMFVWMSPTIPDQEILVNQGGNAPVYWYLKSKGHLPMKAPEERVPAWRLSEIGLTCESSGTSAGHRAIFMANYAPWLLRLGHYANDAFLRDLARSAVIGRYANFPGYHINTARTTIYEKPDYPLRPHKELSVNSFHYNHIWPMASMLLDYLVTDAFVRSQGAIDFPSRFIEGYAYLQNKFYGDRAGKFNDRTNVFLWMPKGLVNPDSIELNWIAARGEDRLLVALMNQSPEPVTTTVRLNRELIGVAADQAGRVNVRRDNGSVKPASMQGGVVEVTVSPLGITTLDIEGVNVKPAFQQQLLAASVADAWREDFVQLKLGETRAMMLNFGRGLRTAYVYLQEDDSRWRSATLHYSLRGDRWETVSDAAYPFEFTVPVPDDAHEFRFKIEGVRLSGETVMSETGKLAR